MAWFKKKKKKKKEEDITQPPETLESPPLEETDAPDDEPPEAALEEVAETPVETEAPPPAAAGKEKPSGGFFGRLKQGLSKTRDVLTTDIDDLFLGKRKIDDDLLEELEEMLITSDMGVQTTMHLMEQIEKRSSKIKTADDLKAVLKEEIRQLMDKALEETTEVQASPRVVLVIGVNGVGKTTTIGKLAARFSESGQSVLLGAADTFRAAAVEQLVIWAERSGVDIVHHRENADPAAVAFDAVEAGTARNKDIVIIDTAGRLHTKVNLMEELKKIKRAVQKKMPDAPHEVLLVLDATTGQNAVSQAKLFDDSIGVTGLVLTKLDGTAKGGVVVSICDSLNVPLKYIGVGEGIDDLQKFDSAQFADALFV